MPIKDVTKIRIFFEICNYSNNQNPLIGTYCNLLQLNTIYSDKRFG